MKTNKLFGMMILLVGIMLAFGFTACGSGGDGPGGDGSVAVTGVALNKTMLTIEAGLVEYLTATVSPLEAANKNVTWVSSNPNIATVRHDGLVTGVAEGTATITVTTADGGKTAACAVTVIPLNLEITVTDGSTLAGKLNWIAQNVRDNAVYIVEVGADESLPPRSLSGGTKKMTIILKGIGSERVISLSENGSLFTVRNGAKLVLDNNITLQGRKDKDASFNYNNASVVTVNSGGALEMKEGSKITGNTISRPYGDETILGGGAVRVEGETYVSSGSTLIPEGTFTMNGGEISGNSTAGYAVGGGVYVGGTFTMNAGTISGNSNTASSPHGGGVFVYGSISYKDGSKVGTFIMNGGTISGNSASFGGGVYINGGTTGSGVYAGNTGVFTMNGGEISGNTTLFDGGGVCVGQKTTFTMNNGTISNNTTGGTNSRGGGGVYVDSGSSGISGGTFTMTGGTITNNTTSGNTGHGGGVHVLGGTSISAGTFTMSGGEISGNTTGGSGGGVRNGGTFTMTGGTISDNTASGTYGSGGGVYGYLTMSGGTISGNTAATGGGGVYGYLTMSGGTISDNSANNGGGVYVGTGSVSTMTTMMTGGEISGNTAATDGGGVYVYADGTFTMNGGEISGNTAATDGGGVYVYGGTSSISGGTFRIVTGTVYGSDETNEALRNTVTGGNASAALCKGGTRAYASRGTLTYTSYGETWTTKADLSTTETTLKVANGEIVQ